MVAVVINIAAEGGLFSKARSASNQTQLEADREELLIAITASMDYISGEVKIQELKTNLGSGWTTEDSSFPYAFTKTSTRNSFLVYRDGSIEDTVVEIFENDFDISWNVPDYNNNDKRVRIDADTSKGGFVSFTDQQAFEYMCDMVGISDYTISKKEFLETAFGMEYDDILSEIESELGFSNLSEESEETIYKICIMGEDYSPDASLAEYISRMASEDYEASTKVLRVNGEDVSEDVECEWSGNDAYYTFADYGEYTIELELDGKKAKAKINVTDLGDCTLMFDSSKKTADITGLNHKGQEKINNGEEIIIPDKVIYGGEEYEITKINFNAFRNLSDLTGTITIPSNVTIIGERAFEGTGITSLVFENGSNLETIGEYAFADCDSLTESPTIPASVARIEAGAFQRTGITGNLIIPASVTSIGYGAFYQTGITSLTFASGSNLETIEGSAFADCDSLTESLTIPASVTSIGNGAFIGTEITSLSFEDNSSLTTIGEQAFMCYNLTGAITIPASVISIGNEAFRDTRITSLIFENGSHLTTIGDYAFEGYFNLTGTLTVPASVTSIGDHAFFQQEITSLVFEDNSNLTTIGNEAFWNSGISGTLTIPTSVTSIGTNAFYGNSITSITVSSTLAASSSSWAPTGVQIIISD